MQTESQVIRIFIASPADVLEERQELAVVVNRINKIVSKPLGIHIDLLGWEDTPPGVGRPQDLINADLDRADLVIACLWRRFGTPAGSGKTGFEEEFWRAMERKKKTGSPDIWLYFKNVDATQLADPGPQLKKVIEFREGLIASRQVLYKTFSTADEWRTVIHDTVMQYVITNVGAHVQIPSGTRSGATTVDVSSTAAPISGISPHRKTEALTEVVTLLRRISNSLETNSFEEGKNRITVSETVRLGVFAASAYHWLVNPITWGVHEINSAYVHRSELKLMKAERDFILRISAFDPTFTRPAWYWAQSPFDVKDFLAAACSDRDESIRVGAIALASILNINLVKHLGDEPLKNVLADSSSVVVSQAALHLVRTGRTKHLELLDVLDSHPDNDVRSVALEAKQAIMIRAHAERSLRKFLDSAEYITDSALILLTGYATDLSETSLVSAYQSTDPRLRAFAVEATGIRKSDPDNLIMQALKDSSLVVRAAAWVERIKAGARSDPRDIRAGLTSSSPTEAGLPAATLKSIIASLLRSYSNEDLWKIIDRRDEDSVLALHELRTRTSDRDRDRIRTIAGENPKKMLRTPDLSTVLSGLLPLTYEATHDSIRTNALDILAAKPTKADRNLFRSVIESTDATVWQRVAAWKGLALVGNQDDLELAAVAMRDRSTVAFRAAIHAYLHLMPNFSSAIDNVLMEPTGDSLVEILNAAAERKHFSIWPQIKPLLSHKDDDVRRSAAVCATVFHSKKELARLLEAYTAEGSYYYYDVVTLWDIMLFAPRSVQSARIYECFSKNQDTLDAIFAFEDAMRSEKRCQRKTQTH